ncbi:hypothetical protein H7H37_23230, partial [Mycolicibacterium insubricum]|nr:hypothetical protein [Mycolicibacterium insubricum]
MQLNTVALGAQALHPGSSGPRMDQKSRTSSFGFIGIGRSCPRGSSPGSYVADAPGDAGLRAVAQHLLRVLVGTLDAVLDVGRTSSSATVFNCTGSSNSHARVKTVPGGSDAGTNPLRPGIAPGA